MLSSFHKCSIKVQYITLLLKKKEEKEERKKERRKKKRVLILPFVKYKFQVVIPQFKVE
jgi:hypothetical protein